MKKTILLTILLLTFFTSCNKLIPRKSGTKIKKLEESKAPIPEFVEIEKYIRSSYNPMDIDEIRRETYIEQSPQLDITDKDMILKGKIRVGMYKEDIFASIGNPENKIQYPTDFGSKEEWIYPTQICSFENGVLKSIEKTVY